MSIGFGKSFQYAGLNRAGVFMEPAKEKGPSADRNVCSTNPTTNSKPNEIWRRYTGIFEGKEISANHRKRGLRILARKISERVRRATLESEPRASASVGLEISLVLDWDFEAATWTRTLNCGISVEALCVELGCTRARLTSLLKEHCGMSAGEFLDGLRFSRLKAGLVTRLREAATELWGFPGSYAAVKVCSEFDSALRHEDTKARNGNESKYFRNRVEEMFEESRGEERVRRVTELCAMLLRDFDLESCAVRSGYESGAKLKRACLNVFGRTLAQIERALASEVVQFYLCAEDRELRAIACSDRLSVEVGRARELYHGDDAKPEAPFVDEYAKFEELKAEWLSRMWDVFNGNDQ
jgi:AraC-like DNA-binding protein